MEVVYHSGGVKPRTATPSKYGFELCNYKRCFNERGKVMNEKEKRKIIPWDEIKERFRKGKNNGKNKS